MNPCACWPRRRDLVAGLIGAVLTAAVLVPVGLSRIHAEGQRAEAAEGEAAELRARIEAARAATRAALDVTVEDLLSAARARQETAVRATEKK
jgi:hypothetical protein